MQALMLEPPAWFLEERRKLGHDRWDEVWEGVLHMVPPPTYVHQSVGTDLLLVLSPVAKARGWRATYETGLFDPALGESDYRMPDLVVVDPSHASRRGVEGRAELVVEILSPNDESRKKLGFYARHAVQEVWLVEPDLRTIEIYTLRGDQYFAVAPERDGAVRSPIFGLAFETVSGPKLRAHWAEGDAEI